jgi:NUMOD4 motif-containing protein
MERWIHISEFPGYSVSNKGRVRNDETGRVLALLKNQAGNVHVGMTRGGVQYKRSVAKLVAKAFLTHNTLEAFDTPIHLDGDKENCDVGNLDWRPRWFAARYHSQFQSYPKVSFNGPVRVAGGPERFRTTWDAVMKFGILEASITESILTGKGVWPTYQIFKRADDRAEDYAS